MNNTITLASLIVTASISLLGVCLSLYSIYTQRTLAILNHSTNEFRAWADRVRAIASEHIATSTRLYLVGADIERNDEHAAVQRLSALEAEISILLVDGSKVEQDLIRFIPELRRIAIRDRDRVHDNLSNEFTTARDQIVRCAAEAIIARRDHFIR
jgi:hypothetical protein